jgi:acyl-CoA thioester hydrolase
MTMHETRLRVRYAETDQMGVAYYSNYLIWMEMGRVGNRRAAGSSVPRHGEAGRVLLAVTEVNCRYLAPACYDDEVGEDVDRTGTPADGHVRL